jgi:transcriptional regulator
MRNKPKESAIPHEVSDTVRKEIIHELLERPCSSKDLSTSVHISEREVHGHLEHIRISIAAVGRHLLVTPAQCKKCGFVFAKRERLKKPGKCPVCRGQSIREPLYAILDTRQHER